MAPAHDFASRVSGLVFQDSSFFRFCLSLEVHTDFPEFSKILCSFVTKQNHDVCKKNPKISEIQNISNERAFKKAELQFYED